MVGRIFVTQGLVLSTAATGNTEFGFAIPIGTSMRGVLTRCYVVQTAGSLDGFTYSLYAVKAACPPGTAPASTATVPQGLYNLVPACIVPAGKPDFTGVLAWPSDGINHLWQPFSSYDATITDARLNMLYLDLLAAHEPTNDKTFSVSLTIGDPTYT